MTPHRISGPLVVACAALMLAGAPVSAWAQAAKGTPASARKHDAEMQGMTSMMGSPHHQLAMAYRDNLSTFARALQKQVRSSKSVDIGLARPAVSEMRRSFDRMHEHHQAMMADHREPEMVAMMTRMEERRTSLNQHLTALESAVNTGAPDYKVVLEHTTAVLTHGAAMSPMAPKAKAHRMK